METSNASLKKTSEGSRHCMAVWILIVAAVAWMVAFGSEDATASQSVTFEPETPKAVQWIIPLAKKGAGTDLNQKVAHLYLECLKKLNRPKCVRLAAIVDHESAGTWNPNVKGDGGCSVGIAQWNRCAGRIADPTFEGQVAQLIQEMSPRMARHTLDEATCQWNSPAMRCGKYVQKVIRSEKNFI